MTLNTIAFLILLALLVRTFGGIALRGAGIVLVFGTIVWLAFGWQAHDRAVEQLVIGAGLWLLGHVHFVLKHHFWLNDRAGRLIVLLMPRRVRSRLPTPAPRDWPT